MHPCGPAEEDIIIIIIYYYSSTRRGIYPTAVIAPRTSSTSWAIVLFCNFIMITHYYHQHHCYHYYPSVQRQSSISTLSCIKPRQRRGGIKKRAGAQEKTNKEMHDGFYFHHAVLLLLFLSMNNLCPEAVHPRGPAEGGPLSLSLLLCIWLPLLVTEWRRHAVIIIYLIIFINE